MPDIWKQNEKINKMKNLKIQHQTIQDIVSLHCSFILYLVYVLLRAC